MYSNFPDLHLMTWEILPELVSDIINNTIASKYDKLTKDMIVCEINDISCKDLGYFKSMELLGKIWREESSILLNFEYENVNDMINTPINNPIYKFLEGVDCEDFYGSFVELGASNLDDLQFIEYDDLVVMNMPILKRRKFHSILLNGSDKLDNLSRLSIYFNPSLAEKERDKELERIKKLHSQKFMINVIEEDNESTEI